MKIFPSFLCLFAAISLFADSSDCCYPATEISCPCYPSGFHASGSWVYLRPTPTDADLEYGSFITLTTPPNLNALLLEVEPKYQSGYRLNLGYRFCGNQSLDFHYLSLHARDKDSKQVQSFNLEEEQIIQNFLGSSYSTAQAQSKQEIDHFGLEYSLEYLFDQRLTLQPFLGVEFAKIDRELDVNYTDIIPSTIPPSPSFLRGSEKSDFWGIGPYAGARFDLSLFCNFSLVGRLTAGVLFGDVRSKVDAEEFESNTTTTFFDKQSHHRAVTTLSTDLGLQYTWVFCRDWGLKIQAGYEIDYYYKAIDRINPFNGFTRNSDTFPVRRSSNLGLGGPYVLVSLDQSILPCMCNLFSCCPLPCPYSECGPYFNFTSAWLEPTPSNNDLVFAILNEQGGAQKDKEVDPDMCWRGIYELGYRFCSSYDVWVSYFGLDQSDRTKVDTTSGQTITSVNASGNVNVLYLSASSRVKYQLDQLDGLFGKYLQVASCLTFHHGVGLRYLCLDREQNNGYFEGSPPQNFETKTNVLKSRYRGIGPIYSFEPDWNLFWGLSIVGKTSLALLVGDLKSTLDQVNTGLVINSSNDLRTPKSPSIVPVFDGQVGLKYNGACGCFWFDLEGGYRYSAYYRGVRLVYPNFLTGLQQINSNLILSGPYFRVGIGANF